VDFDTCAISPNRLPASNQVAVPGQIYCQWEYLEINRRLVSKYVNQNATYQVAGVLELRDRVLYDYDDAGCFCADYNYGKPDKDFLPMASL